MNPFLNMKKGAGSGKKFVGKKSGPAAKKTAPAPALGQRPSIAALDK